LRYQNTDYISKKQEKKLIKINFRMSGFVKILKRKLNILN